MKNAFPPGAPFAGPLPARPAEAHALEVARTLLAEQSAANLPAASLTSAPRIVCTTTGRAQAAHALAIAFPAAQVTAWFLDLHPCAAATASWAPVPGMLEAVCVPDMPPGPYDLAVVPLAKDGEAELTRELLQQAFVQLAIGGGVVAAVDKSPDKWLREKLAEKACRDGRDRSRTAGRGAEAADDRVCRREDPGASQAPRFFL